MLVLRVRVFASAGGVFMYLASARARGGGCVPRSFPTRQDGGACHGEVICSRVSAHITSDERMYKASVLRLHQQPTSPAGPCHSLQRRQHSITFQPTITPMALPNAIMRLMALLSLVMIATITCLPARADAVRGTSTGLLVIEADTDSLAVCAQDCYGGFSQLYGCFEAGEDQACFCKSAEAQMVRCSHRLADQEYR